MTRPPPTADRVRALLNYCPESGAFTWANSKGRAKAGSEAGSKRKRGYVDIMIDGSRFGAHRLAWLLVHGCWPAGEIDHRDGDRANNRIGNLRDVTRAINAQNIRAAHRRSSTGLLGVRPADSVKNPWSAAIHVQGKSRHLGNFKTPEEAHAAYVAAKRDLHQGCTI